MMKRTGLMMIMLMAYMLSYGQDERKVIRAGIKDYEKGDFDNAEVQFRKAESLNHDSYEAEFNTGAALYGQKKYEETAKQYQSMLDQADDGEKTAQIWHNIGNSLLEAQQYGPSIEAYKNALRKNPSDMDTKYNLEYAKQKLKEQQEQQQQQQNQENKNQGENNKDQNKGQQDKNKEQQDQQQQDQQQNQDQEKKADQQDQQQQPVPRQISKEDAQRMLDAIQHQEKEVKAKVDKKKAAVAKVKTEKDW
jgi:Ca-activated chloride channel homolog